MLYRIFELGVIFLLGVGVFWILYFVLYLGAEKRISEAKPRDRDFYLAHIYLFLFKLIFGLGFFVFTAGPVIAILYWIYIIIVDLIS
jgi:succinate-acetate transporter protein